MSRIPILVLGLICLIFSTAQASERGSPIEAEILIKKSVEHYRLVGQKQAFADFTDKSGEFFERDLYVWCVNSANTILFHATTPALIGKNTTVMPDADRKVFAPKLAEDAFANGTATTEYKWINPISNKIEPKIALARKVSDDVVCVVGYYK